jgi:hypothetical protein
MIPRFRAAADARWTRLAPQDVGEAVTRTACTSNSFWILLSVGEYQLRVNAMHGWWSCLASGCGSAAAFVCRTELDFSEPSKQFELVLRFREMRGSMLE